MKITDRINNCHSREGGNPEQCWFSWIPAFAGMTRNVMQSESGQVLPLYVLIVTTMVMLWAFVINTGEIVSHKIKVQTAADLGAYAGASVMAYHMANDVDYMGVLSDSISELNAYLKGEYYNLVSQITLAQCTQRSSSFGRG